eukprot:m.9669 g.9669  ORF g.9669 m.9669 type:complete len:683 (-) comp3004_c0_seq1:41-2089(-)
MTTRMLIAHANSQSRPMGDSKEIQGLYYDVLGGPANHKKLRLFLPGQAHVESLTHLQELLNDLDPHILHFIGHGERRHLKFVGESPEFEAFAEALRAHVSRNMSLRLVVLNCCNGEGLARMLESGDPPIAAIAGDGKLGNVQACDFSWGFYDALFHSCKSAPLHKLLWQISRQSKFVYHRADVQESLGQIRHWKPDEFSLSAFLKLSPRQSLLRWVNFLLPNDAAAIGNFNELKDCQAYTVLLRKLAPADMQLDPVDVLGIQGLIQRATKVIEIAESLGCHMFFDPVDIASGSEEHNEAFVGSLFRLYSAQQFEERAQTLSPHQLLLCWVNFHLSRANAGTEPVRVGNFAGDLCDSRAYILLLHQLAPVELRFDPNRILEMADWRERARNVIEIANSFGCHTYIRVHHTHIVSGSVHHNLALVCALFCFSSPFRHEENHTDLSTLPSDDLLLCWLNFHLSRAHSISDRDDMHINSFDDDLSACEAYIMLLSQLVPDGFHFDPREVLDINVTQRADQVIELAKLFGCHTAVCAQDISRNGTNSHKAFIGDLFSSFSPSADQSVRKSFHRTIKVQRELQQDLPEFDFAYKLYGVLTAKALPHLEPLPTLSVAAGWPPIKFFLFRSMPFLSMLLNLFLIAILFLIWESECSSALSSLVTSLVGEATTMYSCCKGFFCPLDDSPLL